MCKIVMRVPEIVMMNIYEVQNTMKGMRKYTL